MFTKIPDLICLILLDLEIGDIINFGLTCKFYWKFLQNNTFWKNKYHYDFGEELESNAFKKDLSLTFRQTYVQRYTQEGGITYGSQYFTTLDVLIPRFCQTLDYDLISFFIRLYDIVYDKSKDTLKGESHYRFANSLEIMEIVLIRCGYDIAYRFYQGAKIFQPKEVNVLSGILLGYAGEYYVNGGWDHLLSMVKGAILSGNHNHAWELLNLPKSKKEQCHSFNSLINFCLRYNYLDFLDELLNKKIVRQETINSEAAKLGLILLGSESKKKCSHSRWIEIHNSDQFDLDEYREILAHLGYSHANKTDVFLFIGGVPPRENIIDIYKDYGLNERDIYNHLDTKYGFPSLDFIKKWEIYSSKSNKESSFRIDYFKTFVNGKYFTYDKALLWLKYIFVINPVTSNKRGYMISAYLRILYRKGYKDLWYYTIKNYANNRDKIVLCNNKLDRTPCEMKFLLDKYNQSKTMTFTQLVKSIYM